MNTTNPTPFLFLSSKKGGKKTIKDYFFVLWNALLGRFNTDKDMTVVTKGYLDYLAEQENDKTMQLWEADESIQALRLKLRSERVSFAKLLSLLDDVLLAWKQDDAYPSSDGLIKAMEHLKGEMLPHYAIYRPEYSQWLEWEYKLLDKQEMYDRLTSLRNGKGE